MQIYKTLSCYKRIIAMNYEVSTDKTKSTNKEKIKILYIDDEENNLVAFKATFRRIYHVATAISAKEGKLLLECEQFHIVISDQRMPDQTGVEFFEEIRFKYPEPIRILLTGFADVEAVIAAINRGEVYRYINKPWSQEDLQIIISQAFEIFALREENKKLTADLYKANEQLEFLLRQKLLS